MTLEKSLQGGTSAGCPACDCPAAPAESLQTETVYFGDDREEISVSVPVRTCIECGFEFTDLRAEQIRRDAVYRHQDLLTPDEIASVRTSLGMSRRAFSEAFGIPTASMERWEKGRLFQNKSSDTLLRMLQDPAIARRFDRRLREEAAAPNNVVVAVEFRPRYLSPLQVEDAEARAANFRLRG